jgi:hypothetical protein
MTFLCAPYRKMLLEDPNYADVCSALNLKNLDAICSMTARRRMNCASRSEGGVPRSPPKWSIATLLIWHATTLSRDVFIVKAPALLQFGR